MNLRARLLPIIAFLGMLSISSGCVSTAKMLYSFTGGLGVDKVIKFRHPETGREVVMIGMIHFEKKDFFDETRLYLDSLKQTQGYVVFYEKIGRQGIDSMRLDTLLRKFRRVTGVDLERRNEKLTRSGKYVMQSTELLGLTSERDIRVDMTWDEMITEYENRYEEIVLTDYDWQTPLTEKYKRRRSGKQEYSPYHMSNTIRNGYIVDAVKSSDHDRIVLLYGKGHWMSIVFSLEDMGYQIVEGKL